MIISNVAKLIQGQPLAEVKLTANVQDACEIMCQMDVRAVAVSNDEGKLMGVVSERDVVRRCVCGELIPKDTGVDEIMTWNPKSIDASGSLADALDIMSQGGFHHIPVLQNDKVIGVLSSDDIPEEYRMMLERFRELTSR